MAKMDQEQILCSFSDFSNLTAISHTSLSLKLQINIIDYL